MTVAVDGPGKLLVRMVDTPDDVAVFWAWLTGAAAQGWIACDTESTTTAWTTPDFRVRLIQFGDCEGGWALEPRRWYGLAEAAFAWLRAHRVTIVFHNHVFDCNALWTAGFSLDWRYVADTFVIAALVGYADQPRGLKEVATKVFGPWAAAGERMLHKGMKANGWTWATVPIAYPAYPTYAVVDTVLTARLWRTWLGRWDPALHDLEIRTGEVVSGMMRRGLTVDGNYLYGAVSRSLEAEAEVAAHLRSLGVTSPSRNAEVAEVLRRDNVPLPGKTTTGQDSVAKEILAAIDHPVARLVLEYRRLHKIRVAYLEKLLAACPDGGLGVVHATIKPMEARTARMSIESPPMQQLPRDDKVVRTAVVPTGPDDALVSSDYGQIEMRMWARVTGDAELTEVFRRADEKGEDFFTEVGRDVYAEPDFVKTDRRRSLIKNLGYSVIYGAGLDTMAATARVKVEQMAPVQAAMKARYPSYRTLGTDLISAEPGGGWQVTCPDGRVIRVSSRDEVRKLPNYLIQGSSAGILKRGMVTAADAGLEPFLLLPVHDELLLSVPREDAVDAAQALSEAMGLAANLPVCGGGPGQVRITADPAGPADNWAALKG